VQDIDMTGIRISFAASLRHTFSELAGIYEAEFGEMQFSQVREAAEPGTTGNLVMVVPEDLPAFLSSKGFPFQTTD
jgi:hypothetical protein